jgi:hypothetical protein
MEKTRFCITCDKEKPLTEEFFITKWCGLFSKQCKECDEREKEDGC